MKIENFEIKDDNTILYNGKTFKAEHNQPSTVEQAELKWCESFEVLEFHNGEPDGIITNIGGDAWNFEVNPNQANLTLAQLIGFTTELNSQVVIFKIRRKSDAAVFTVGDKVQTEYDGVLEIRSFKIAGDRIVFSFDFGDIYAEHCTTYTEPKQTLFTTYDGVDLFNADTFITVDKTSYEIGNGVCFSLGKSVPSTWKLIDSSWKFSTHDAAVEYVKMNKPCLSVQNVLAEILDFEDSIKDGIEQRLKALVKL